MIKNYHALNEALLLSENLDLHCILLDISIALDRIDVTDNQAKILDKYMNGYTIQEISSENEYSKSYVDSVLTKICKRVKKELV